VQLQPDPVTACQTKGRTEHCTARPSTTTTAKIPTPVAARGVRLTETASAMDRRFRSGRVTKRHHQQ
jgi:hypothetical protein